MSVNTFQSDRPFWDKVIIDEDPSLVGMITAVQFRPTPTGGVTHVLEVSYVHNGDVKVAWIEPHRLSSAE